MIKVRVDETVNDPDGNGTSEMRIVETTVGMLIDSILHRTDWSTVLIGRPKDTKKAISRLINSCYRRVGLKETVIFADQLMYMGFSYATRSGSSIGVNDFEIPEEKAQIIGEAEGQVKEIEDQFSTGLVTQGEKYNKVIDIWARANDDLVAKKMMERIGKEDAIDAQVKQFSKIHLTQSL